MVNSLHPFQQLVKLHNDIVHIASLVPRHERLTTVYSAPAFFLRRQLLL